ncbi:MAG: hypothetical protein PVH87_06270, partial [Desulfobacteraceae bacterium]
MITIAVPLWILAFLIGMPMLGLLWLLGMLIKKIRKPQKDMLVNAAMQYLNTHQPTPSQFHNDLLALQIDAIFNGMSAIIETERIKIRSLLNGSGNIGLNTVSGDKPSCVISEMESRTEPVVKEKDNSLEQQIANYSASGNQPE